MANAEEITDGVCERCGAVTANGNDLCNDCIDSQHQLAVIRGREDCREEGRHLWGALADQAVGSTVECPRCHTTRFKPLGGGYPAYGGAPGWPVRRM